MPYKVTLAVQDNHVCKPDQLQSCLCGVICTDCAAVEKSSEFDKSLMVYRH